MKRIALTIERMRAHGRNICEGIAAYAQEHGEDWSLEFVDSPAVGGRREYVGYDGVIVRVMDDRTATRLRALKCPIVDVFCNKVRTGIVGVVVNHTTIGKLAGRHFITRNFAHFVQLQAEVRCIIMQLVR